METKKKVTKKIISSKAPVKVVEEVVEVVEEEEQSKAADVRTKKVCFFCQSKSVPAYTDLVTLRRFLTDRAKIQAKLKSNVCSRHQRGVSKNIKYARHLALLPFVPKV